MEVNDNAFILDERGAPESIASLLAPTVDLICHGCCERHMDLVGVTLLAMQVARSSHLIRYIEVHRPLRQ